MNLTLSQAFERTKDLSGELKAARAHEADCAADHEAKLRIAEIAAEAHEKASAHCIELEQEREALADHMAALVRKTGEPLESEAVAYPVTAEALENAASLGRQFNSVFTEPADFQAQALQNGEAKMNAAFDEATR